MKWRGIIEIIEQEQRLIVQAKQSHTNVISIGLHRKVQKQQPKISDQQQENRTIKKKKHTTFELL